MIAGYVRVSTDEQAKRFGLDVQKEKIKQYAELYNLGKVKFYVDDGYTGWSLDRPAMRKLMEDVKAGKITKVIVYKADRISRHLKDLLILIEDVFSPAGVAFISVTEHFNTEDPQGKLFLQMLGSFAEFERNMIKERTLNGRIQKARQGGHAVGELPLGYRKKGERIELSEDARIVKRIFAMREEGFSFRKIAEILNTEGICTKRGGKWYASTIRYICTNPKYQGVQVYRFGEEEIQGAIKPIVR